MNHASSSPSVSRAGTILPWHPRLPSLGGRHPSTHPATLNVGGIKSPGCTVGPEESCALRAESQRVGVRKWRDASLQMAQQKPELLRQYWQSITLLQELASWGAPALQHLDFRQTAPKKSIA